MIDIINVNKEMLYSLGTTTPNSKAIRYNGELVGIIDFFVKGSMVKIMYININKKYRRQGIAGKVINMLKDNHKGKYMYGDAVPDALKFWESMGAIFDEDPEEDYLTPFHIEC